MRTSEEEVSFRSGLPFLIILCLPPIVGYIWRGFVFGDWGSGILGLILSAGPIWLVWYGLVMGATNCNGRVYHRDEQSARYWLVIGIWLAGYALCVASFFFAQPSGGAG